MSIIQHDPAVASVAGFTGGRQTNSGFRLRVIEAAGRARTVSRPRDRTAASQAERRGGVLDCSCKPRRTSVPAAGRATRNTSIRCTADTSAELYEWAPKLTAALQKRSELADVNSDQQQKGLETDLIIDRPTAARLGLTPSAIDNTLYDAFGQRDVVDHLQRAQSIPRGDGTGAALLAEPGYAETDLGQHVGRQRQGYADDQCAGRHRDGSERVQQHHHGGDRGGGTARATRRSIPLPQAANPARLPALRSAPTWKR